MDDCDDDANNNAGDMVMMMSVMMTMVLIRMIMVMIKWDDAKYNQLKYKDRASASPKYLQRVFAPFEIIALAFHTSNLTLYTFTFSHFHFSPIS